VHAWLLLQMPRNRTRDQEESAVGLQH